ncbi:MAG: ATPase [Actinomycetales bacterium]|nr:ATPase [Actinomycetales bacterium]
MPVDVRVETVIDSAPERVASLAGDPANAPRWYANIRSVDWQTPPPVAVGSRLDFVAQFLGRRLAYTYEVVELEPERRLVMRTTDGPFPMETTYSWDPAGAGQTRMTLRNRGNPSGFSRMAAPVLERAMRRATTKDLARLKAILEVPPASV